MAAISTIIAAIGTAAAVAGTAAGVVGQMQAAQGQKKAERLRKEQMNLDAQRQRREVIRRALVARSTALNTAASQGGQFGSGLAGGEGEISGEGNRATRNVNQNQEIGAGLFDANAQTDAGLTVANTGAGLSSLGGAIVKNQDVLGRLGTYVAG